MIKDYFKTECFASKWFIKVEANIYHENSLLLNIEIRALKEECFFRWLCVIKNVTMLLVNLCKLNFCQSSSVYLARHVFEQGI